MVRVRIVSKSKNGPILAVGPMKQEMSWDEFNSDWTIDTKDKLYAIMKPETEEKAQKVHEVVNDAVLAMMLGRNDKNFLTSASMMGSALERFQQLEPNGSPADFLKLVQIALNKQTNDMLRMGVGFTAPDDERRFNAKQKRQNKRNLKRLEEEQNAKPKEDTDADHFTIGDAIKAQKEKQH